MWAGCPGQLCQTVREVGKLSQEAVRRQPMPAAGREAQAVAHPQRTGCHGRECPSAHPQSSSPPCKPHAWYTMQPCAGRHSGTASCTMQPFARAHFLECLFKFFSTKAPKGASHMPHTKWISNSRFLLISALQQ